MPLINFGSILSFAEEIEKQQLDFCTQALQNSACAEIHSQLETVAKAAKKRVSEVQRVRRENVSEMILETFEGFVRAPFLMENKDPSAMSAEETTAQIHQMGDRAMDYYEKAAAKMKSQKDVARALKGLKKKHSKDQKNL